MTVMLTSRRLFLGGLFSALAAPAIVRVDNIMPVVRMILSEFSYESFDQLMPKDVQYQWVTADRMMKDLLGMPQTSLDGWKVVPPSRHNRSFAINGDAIQIGKSVLMECPKHSYDVARGAEIAKAQALTQRWTPIAFCPEGAMT